MATVTFSPNHQPAPACYPPDVNAMLDMLTTGGGLSGTVPDNAGGGIFVGSSPPSSSLTNKVWYKTDGAGRPLGVYMFYNGNWRKVYTGNISEIRLFGGNPASYFDGSGRGIIGGDYDGWALCNGNNGTDNLMDKFIVAGNQFSGAWLTSVSGPLTAGGGANSITIARNNLPALYDHHTIWYDHQFQPQAGGIEGPWTQGQGTNWPIDIEGVGANLPIPALPPYIALGYIQFVGYA